MRLIKIKNGNLVATLKHGPPPVPPVGYVPSEYDAYILEPKPGPCLHRSKLDQDTCCITSIKYKCAITGEEITLDVCITCGNKTIT